MQFPPALLKAHPQLEFISKAITAHRRGEPALECPECSEVITVTELTEVGMLQTACGCRYCNHRLKWDPVLAGDRA